MPEHPESQNPDPLWNFTRKRVLWVDILAVIGLLVFLVALGICLELYLVEPFLIRHHLMNPRF